MSELIERGVGSRLTRRGSLSSLAAVFGGSAVLAACGGESAPAAAPTAAKAAPTVAAAATTAPAATAAPTAAPKPVTIKVTARTVSEAEMWDVRIPIFQKENPGITVEKDLNDGDIIAKITTLIAAGSIGDVVHTHPSQAQPQRLYLAKSMKDLDALIARDKVDLKQWYPAAIDAGRLDGKVISLPFKGKMAAVAFFYNKSLFDQAGVKVPDANTTMADIMEAAVKLTKPDGSQWGIATTLPKDSRTLTGTLRRWNAELLDKEAKKGMLASTEAGAAFAWFYDAFHKRKVADPKADIQKLFVEGKAAMLMNLDFNVKTAIQPAAKQFGYEYSAILAPKGPTGRRGGIWVPDALQLSATSPNPDQAWKVLQFFASKDTGLALAMQKTGSTTPGARPDVYNDPKFVNHEVFAKILQELDRDANELGETYQVPGNYKITEFNKALGDAVNKVWENQGEPTPSYLKALNDELQNILDLPR
ncbi:MAG: extracellular solute-binding protein [Chloroflexi bacterium]|nr:MAG: extracellular solute-binding protein [Chloroflexota bacterium]